MLLQGKVEEKVAADEGIDVAILTKPRVEKLVRVAKLVGGTTTVLVRVPMAALAAAPVYKANGMEPG